MKKSKLMSLAIIMLLMCSSSLFAYQLSPLSATYAPTGADSAKVYTITNDSDSPIAIEMKVMKRMIDKDGKEVNEAAPAYFSIQPSKMIIKPQSTQIVRVQYRGPRTVTKEMSFRIIAEQIAYSQGAASQSEGPMINFLFVYSTSAYVKPSKEIVSIASSAAIVDEGIKVRIANTGSVHQILTDLSITLSGNGNTYALTEEEIGDKDGMNLLTDSEVEILIPMPEELRGAGSITADVSYAKGN